MEGDWQDKKIQVAKELQTPTKSDDGWEQYEKSIEGKNLSTWRYRVKVQFRDQRQSSKNCRAVSQFFDYGIAPEVQIHQARDLQHQTSRLAYCELWISTLKPYTYADSYQAFGVYAIKMMEVL